jgi:acetyltransferase-like isoleucine patch superfamily enzyme
MLRNKILAVLDALCRESSIAIVSTLPNGGISCWLRRKVYNYWGCEIENGALIYRNVLLLGRVVIGKGTSVSNNTVINGVSIGVFIGEDVMIAPGCCIVAFDHGMEDNGIQMSKQALIERRITIHNDVWIGANCTIASGVIIGQGAVIAANAAVTRNVAEYSVIGGVPAKFIKSRKAKMCKE